MLKNCPKYFNSFTIRSMLLDVGARVERVNNPSESANNTIKEEIVEKFVKTLEILR